ncbi:MAG: esterase family protein [Candidatus Marinimicrobia bacterium]|nr:esterase family protein [Candidatus Neomarinimicrobiota bacterium]
MNTTQKIYRSLLALLTLLMLGGSLSAGSIKTDGIRSVVLKRNWDFHVYLPDGYDPSGDRTYPVIYCLHGSGGNEQDWDRAFPLLDTLISQGLIPPVIAVAPGSKTSWWVDGVEKFESAFFQDLVPYVEKNYRITGQKESRIITGFSMGGYGALRYALIHPELFGGAILLSPALYSELPPLGSSARSSGAFGKPFSEKNWQERNYPQIIDQYRSAQSPVTIFIAAGDDDWNEPEGSEYNMEYQTVILYQALNKKMANPSELRIVNGGHDWKLWLPLFKEGLILSSRQLTGFRTGIHTQLKQ